MKFKNQSRKKGKFWWTTTIGAMMGKRNYAYRKWKSNKIKYQKIYMRLRKRTQNLIAKRNNHIKLIDKKI